MRVRFAPDRKTLKINGPGVGRSAYVCSKKSCIDGLFEKSRLSRALGTEVHDSLKVTAHKELSCLQR